MATIQTIYNTEAVILQTIYQSDNTTLSSIYDVTTNNNTTAINNFFSSTELSVTAAGTLSISAGTLFEKVIAIAGSNGQLKLGTSVGGSQIGTMNLTANVPMVRQVDYYFENAGTLHLTGTATVYIFLR